MTTAWTVYDLVQQRRALDLYEKLARKTINWFMVLYYNNEPRKKLVEIMCSAL